MNASRPDFVYQPDIKQLTDAILWLLKDVDDDIVQRALNNTIFERKLTGTVFSREDITDSVKEHYYEQKYNLDNNIPKEEKVQKIVDEIMESDWWQHNSLGTNSSYSLYRHIETIIGIMPE